MQLACAATAATWRSTVRDNGVGIPPEMLPRVFDLFTQVGRNARSRAGRARHRPDAGAAPRRDARRHGRRPHSDGPGRGSTFTVRLPLARRQRAARPMPPAGAAPTAAGAAQRLRVLVVDDNVDGAETLALLLRTARATRSRVAHDGPGGAGGGARSFAPRGGAARHRPAGLDGYEVARRVRASAVPATAADAGGAHRLGQRRGPAPRARGRASTTT